MFETSILKIFSMFEFISEQNIFTEVEAGRQVKNEVFWRRLITLSHFSLYISLVIKHSCRAILTLINYSLHFSKTKALSSNIMLSSWFKHQRFPLYFSSVHRDIYESACVLLCLVYLFLLNLTGKTTPTDWSNPITPTLLTFSMR